MNRSLNPLLRILKSTAGATGAAALLLCQGTSGQTIPNPSFEANTFTGSPGYISANTPITGWLASPSESVGLNPAGGGSPFADNGAVPDGVNVAFIQSSASISTLSTTISGLTVGTTYKVTFRENARNGQTPNMEVSIDSVQVLALTTYSAGGANPYWYIAFEFTATATSQVLAIQNDASGDNTLLLDDFHIAPSSGKWTVDAWTDDSTSGVDANYFYTHAYAFNNSANPTINGVAFTGLSGANPTVAGRLSTTYFGNATSRASNVTGDSATMGGPFVYGGSIPAGAFQSITINGLTPGTEYIATVFSFAWDDPSLTIRWVTFSMGEDRLTVNQDQFFSNNGIRVSYRYVADATGSATIKIVPINPNNVSFHVCGFCNREAVSHNVAPVINAQPQSTVVAPGIPVTFTVVANGLPAPTYQWQLNGVNIAGAQGATYTPTDPPANSSAGANYVLDDGAINSDLNASDGTEPLDNWWANKFTAVAGGNVITEVDFACGSFATNASAIVSIYRVTDSGGNPAKGATRLYSQSFTPNPNAAGTLHINQIFLKTPVALNVGDVFLVSIFSTNVLGLAPNDKYPLAIDKGTNGSAGSYWDRSAPNKFNLDDLSQAEPISVALPADGSGAAPFVPSTAGGHLLIRAIAYPNVSAAANYDVVLSNAAGSVTSAVARLVVGMALNNPSFEVDSFLNWPGYCGNNGGNQNAPITGWTLDNLDGGGVNPIADGRSPFADNGAIPNGTNVAFIQASGDTLHQTISGFTVGSQYSVHYYQNARTGGPLPSLQVTMGGATVLAAQAINPVGNGPYYEVYSDVFVATNTSLELAFTKGDGTAGDSTALIDNVTVLPILPGTAPFAVANPTPVLVSVGDAASFSARGVGSLPITYQWLKNGAPITGETNSVLNLGNIQKPADADYSLVFANSAGSATSAVAHLTVYEPIPDLYATGVDDSRVVLGDAAVDPHYQITVNPDTNSTLAIVQTVAALPGAWMADDATSKWIGPEANTSAGAVGYYTYRTSINLANRDPKTVVIIGQWATDNVGHDIQLNGVTTGNPQNTTQFAGWTTFNLYGTNGFIAGTNYIDFIVENAAPAGYTGLKVKFLLSNVSIPAGTPPQILAQPASVTNATVGDTVTFTAGARGTAPLSYQWKKDGAILPGQTTLTLTLTNVAQSDSGSYVMTVSNSVGTTNTQPAQLAVIYSVIPGHVFGTGLAADGSLLLANSNDPHYLLTYSDDPNYPATNAAVVLTNAWPIQAGVWILNGPNSEWIAPSLDQTVAGSAPGNYDYLTTFDLSGLDPAKIVISGGWATDNTGTDILLNGASTGFTCAGFGSLTPFTLVLTNGLVAAKNTLEFDVNNAGTANNPSGLRVDLKVLGLLPPLAQGPTLKITRSGGNIVISWTPAASGQKLLKASSPNGTWSEVTGASNPYTAPVGAASTYFRVSQ